MPVLYTNANHPIWIWLEQCLVMQREMTGYDQRNRGCSGPGRAVLSRAVYCRADQSKTDNKSSWKTANTITTLGQCRKTRGSDMVQTWKKQTL